MGSNSAIRACVIRLALITLAILVSSAVCAQSMDSQRASWRTAKALQATSNPADAVLVRTLASSANCISYEYAMPQPTFKHITDASVRRLLNAGKESIEDIKMGNALTWGDEGKPVLPYVTTKIVIPTGYEVAGVDVQPGQQIVVLGKHMIRHGLPYLPRSTSVEQAPATKRNTKIYNSDAIYPSKLFDVTGIQKKCGVSILCVVLYPVQYTPLSGKISYFRNLKVDVSLKPAAGDDEWQAIYRPDVDGEVFDSVDNPAEAESYDVPSAKQVKAFDVESAAVNTGDVSTMSLAAGSYTYVVIAPSALSTASVSPSLNDLINHRKMQGFTANVVTTEYIYANYTGTDNQEKIRNFIRDAYNNWGTRYVCLCGDESILPVRIMAEGYEWDTTGVASDIYYACLDGTYDNNGNGMYGQLDDGINGGIPDFQAEVRVGRISAENATEMSNHIYKIIAHENEAPSAATNSVWFSGEELDPGLSGSDFCSVIRYGGTSGFTSMGFTQATPAWMTSDVYMQNHWGDYSPAQINMINSNSCTVWVHSGHGWSNGYGGLMWFDQSTGDPFIDPGTDNSMTNTKYIFAYPDSCETGYFNANATHNGDCFAEHMTNSTRTGLYGCVMSTNSRPYDGSIPTAGDELVRHFFDFFLAQGYSRIGDLNGKTADILGAGSCQNPGAWPARYMVYESELFGDPLTRLRGNCACYTITASNGSGGTISPAGSVYAESGETRVFTITPNVGYTVSQVTVDGVNVGAVSSYTFSNITANHTISVTFNNVTTGLLAYYMLNSTSGSTATDTSGNGRNGTLSGGYSWTSGKVGNCVSLNGSTGYASIPDLGSQSSFTISTWLYIGTLPTSGNYAEILGTDSTATGGLACYVNSSGKVICQVTGWSSACTSATSLTKSRWTLVTMVYDGFAKTAKIYINGTQNVSQALTSAVAANLTAVKIGSLAGTSRFLNGKLDDFRIYNRALSAAEITALYNYAGTWTIASSAGTGGSISPSGNVAVSNGANQTFTITPSTGYTANVVVDGVSQGAIGSYTFSNVMAGHTISATFTQNTYTIVSSQGAHGLLYHLGNVPVAYGGSRSFVFKADTGYTPYVTVDGVNLGPIASPYTFSNVTANHTISVTFVPVVLAYYRFDETSGSTAFDATGNGHNGTVTSGTWTAGKFSNGLSFDGTRTYAALPNGLMSGLNDFSISAWVYLNANSTWSRIFDFGSGTGTYMYLTPSNGGGIRYAITTSGGGGEQGVDGAAALPTGSWQFVTVTQSGNTCTLYVNGVEVGQNTGVTLKPSSLGTTTQTWIGRSQYADPYFNGKIDDFKIFGKALSASEVTALYAAGGSDLVTYCMFDETSGSTAYDSSGHGKTGSLNGGCYWANGHTIGAVGLDGGSGYVSLPDGLVSSLNDFSIVTWVKLNDNITWDRIFDFGSGTGSYMFLSPVGGAGVVRYSITNTGGGAGEQIVDGTYALYPGPWWQVAVTQSGNTCTLYVNGVEVGQNTGVTLKPSSLGTTTQTWIGRSQYDGDAYFNGLVDGFRIYNRALSSAEISNLYGGGVGAASLDSESAGFDIFPAY